MRHITTGIVLHYLKYSDTSIIVKIVTRELGVRSFIVKGIRSKKSKLNVNQLRPLSLIDMEVYLNDKREDQLGRLVNYMSCNSVIKEDIAKNTSIIFIAELLYKCVEEGDVGVGFFEFLWDSILILHKSERFSTFHLVFMLNLAKHLGFFPNAENAIRGSRFDIHEGVFVSFSQFSDSCMPLAVSTNLASLIGVDVESHERFQIPHEERNELLDQLLLFYNAQLPNMKKINSHHILREVLG